MTEPGSIGDYEQRLKDLEASFRKRETVVKSHADVPDELKQGMSKIRERTGNLSGRIESAREKNVWDEVKHEIHADLESLTHVFERWARHVDRDYRGD